eukprot:6361706-Karenia_brevis.AAC.1
MALVDVSEACQASPTTQLDGEQLTATELLEVASLCTCNRIHMTDYVASRPLQEAMLRSKKGSMAEKT